MKSTTISFRPVLGAAAALWCLFAVTAGHAAQIEEAAEQALRDMGDYLKRSEQFTFRVEELFDVGLEIGATAQLQTVVDVAVMRPDRIYARSEGDISNEQLWLDGEHLTLLDVRRGIYAKAKVPPTIDAALDHVAERYGLTFSLADLFYADPYAILVQNVETGLYLGRHSVGERTAHHLLFVQDDIDWQLWIDDGFVPVPLKVVITLKTEPASPRLVFWLTRWNFTPKLPKRLFDFEPPVWASEVELENLVERRKRLPSETEP